MARQLPEILRQVPLAPLTTIRIGGPAVRYAEPATDDELKYAIEWAAGHGMDVRVVGFGSNLLVADEGVNALVLRLRGSLASVEVDGTRLVVGGGAANGHCLRAACYAGLGGFEFACGIPGTAGGGVRTNAGAYKGEWKAIVSDALVVSPEGALWRDPADLEMTYRDSNLESREIVAKVIFQLAPSSPHVVRDEIARLTSLRRAARQPTGRLTFGSVFKNPRRGPTAGQLIDACGLTGRSIRGARISPGHGNFIENRGAATCGDVVQLMLEAHRTVVDRFGVMLTPEVEFLGMPSPLELSAVPSL